MGPFRKGKTRIIAKFLRADLVICSYSREGETPSYIRKNTVCLTSASAGKTTIVEQFIARFPFVDWAEMLEAWHSMSKLNSPQEKSLKKHVWGLLRIIARLKKPSKRYRSV